MSINIRNILDLLVKSFASIPASIPSQLECSIADDLEVLFHQIGNDIANGRNYSESSIFLDIDPNEKESQDDYSSDCEIEIEEDHEADKHISFETRKKAVEFWRSSRKNGKTQCLRLSTVQRNFRQVIR